MTRDDIIRMAQQNGFQKCDCEPDCQMHFVVTGDFERFAALVASAEREKVAQWMMQRGYATGHGDTTEELLQELDWQIAENWTRAMVNGAAAEREECAKVCEEFETDMGHGQPQQCADAIRARGQNV